MAEPGHDGKPRRRSCRGRGEESDGCVVPVKPRTKPTTNRWRRWWREGGRPEGRRAATHAPDSVPDTVCHRSCEPADWGCMGRQSPEPQSRWTFGRSPVRGSRTPGSARGGRGNPVPYRYRASLGKSPVYNSDLALPSNDLMRLGISPAADSSPGVRKWLRRLPQKKQAFSIGLTRDPAVQKGQPSRTPPSGGAPHRLRPLSASTFNLPRSA